MVSDASRLFWILLSCFQVYILVLVCVRGILGQATVMFKLAKLTYIMLHVGCGVVT